MGRAMGRERSKKDGTRHQAGVGQERCRRNYRSVAETDGDGRLSEAVTDYRGLDEIGQHLDPGGDVGLVNRDRSEPRWNNAWPIKCNRCAFR